MSCLLAATPNGQVELLGHLRDRVASAFLDGVRRPVGEYLPNWALVYDENGTTRLYVGPVPAVDYNYTTGKHMLLTSTASDDGEGAK